MKTLAGAVLTAAMLLISTPGYSNVGSCEQSNGMYECNGGAGGGGNGMVPEMDAGAAGLGIGLVLAIAALIRERRK